MNTRKKIWNRLFSAYSLVDLVGVIGLILAITYVPFGKVVFPDNPSYFDGSPTYLDLWSNLAVEVVSIWLSVRLIEALISSKEKRIKRRTRAIRNLRFLFMKIKHFLPRSYRTDINIFNVEFKYSKNTFETSWKKHLSGDEQDDVKNAYEKFEIAADLATQHDDLHRAIHDINLKIDVALANHNKKKNTTSIYRHSFTPLLIVENEFGRFLNREDYDTDQLIQRAEEGLALVYTGFKSLEPSIRSYMLAMIDIASVRVDLVEAIRAADTAFYQAEANILDEHDEEF